MQNNDAETIYSSPARTHFEVQQKRDEIRKWLSQASKRVVKLQLALEKIETGKGVSSAVANRFLVNRLPDFAPSTVAAFRSSPTTPFSRNFANHYVDLVDEELRSLALRLSDATAEVLDQLQELAAIRQSLGDDRLFKRRKYPWRKLDQIKAYHAEQRAALLLAQHSINKH